MDLKCMQQRDFETSPTQYHEYLITCFNNAKRILSEPEKNWPAGSSHVISRQQILEIGYLEEENKLDHGRWTADGKFAGFSN